MVEEEKEYDMSKNPWWKAHSWQHSSNSRLAQFLQYQQKCHFKVENSIYNLWNLQPMKMVNKKNYKHGSILQLQFKKRCSFWRKRNKLYSTSKTTCQIASQPEKGCSPKLQLFYIYNIYSTAKQKETSLSPKNRKIKGQNTQKIF